MGKNNGVKIVGKNKINKVAKISYTPQTMAAAIAKNIRAEQQERDFPTMNWNQRRWGQMTLNNLTDSKSRIEVRIPGLGFQDQPIVREYVGVSCPTTGCIAGWATALDGAIMVVTQRHLNEWDGAHPEENILTKLCYKPGEANVENISDRARMLLGLDGYESSVLFSEDRTIHEVLEILDAIATGQPIKETGTYQRFGYIPYE